MEELLAVALLAVLVVVLGEEVGLVCFAVVEVARPAWAVRTVFAAVHTDSVAVVPRYAVEGLRPLVLRQLASPVQARNGYSVVPLLPKVVGCTERGHARLVVHEGSATSMQLMAVSGRMRLLQRMKDARIEADLLPVAR